MHLAQMAPLPFLTGSDDGDIIRRYMVKQTDYVCAPLPYISVRSMHGYRHLHRQIKINDGGNRVRRTCFFFFQEPKTKCRSTLCSHHSIFLVEPSFVSFTFIYFIFPTPLVPPPSHPAMSAIIPQVQQLLGQVAQYIPHWFTALPTSLKIVIAVIGIPAFIIGLNVFHQLVRVILIGL